YFPGRYRPLRGVFAGFRPARGVFGRSRPAACTRVRQVHYLSESPKSTVVLSSPAKGVGRGDNEDETSGPGRGAGRGVHVALLRPGGGVVEATPAGLGPRDSRGSGDTVAAGPGRGGAAGGPGRLSRGAGVMLRFTVPVPRLTY